MPKSKRASLGASPKMRFTGSGLAAVDSSCFACGCNTRQNQIRAYQISARATPTTTAPRANDVHDSNDKRQASKSDLVSHLTRDDDLSSYLWLCIVCSNFWTVMSDASLTIGSSLSLLKALPFPSTKAAPLVHNVQHVNEALHQPLSLSAIEMAKNNVAWWLSEAPQILAHKHCLLLL